VTCLIDCQASEDLFLKEARGKQVIHIITHGYYHPYEPKPVFDDLDNPVELNYTIENSLLRSGLFLAGGNLHGEGAGESGLEDGILTAEEISTMDLSGTDLVVISACESGLGEVQSGEGIYGLRRAWQRAGVRSVVSALWKIPDQMTSSMMKHLYDGIDLPLCQRMRQMQLMQINKLRTYGIPDHPYLWAGFIATGDWR
jgi:CHAT domain-containing protein